MLVPWLVGCAGPDTDPTPPATLTVVSANVGNPDEALGGPCPAAPYHGATCSIAVEDEVAASLAALQADVIVLLEVLDADLCGPDTWSGEPDLACTGAPDRDPYQQARRYVGDDFTIACDGIAHYDCVALRTTRFAIQECEPGGTCIGGATTPPHPAECAANGGITSVSRVTGELDGEPLSVVVTHPLAGATPDPCRTAQLEQALVDLPVGPSLVAGDFNIDPWRTTDEASAELFFAWVGDGRRFVDHTSIDGGPPTPTWGGLVALDHVLSDAFDGHCDVLGVTAGTTPLDPVTGTFDHRAVSCVLTPRQAGPPER